MVLKKKVQSVIAKIMVCAMVLSLPAPVTTSVSAAGQVNHALENRKGDGESLKFSENSKYAMIAESNKKAVNTEGISWTNHTKVQGEYNESLNQLTEETALFVITPQTGEDSLGENEVKVMIQCNFNGALYPLRTETGNDYSFADNEGDGGAGRYDGAETYIIKKTGENTGIIQAASNSRYATVDNGELRFNETTDADAAEKFFFAENPTIPNTTYTIEHVASGNYVKTYPDENTPLTVDGTVGEDDTVFKTVIFGINNSSVIGEGIPVVTFISKKYGNAMLSTHDWPAVADFIKTTSNTNGGGWESVQVVPNGDGTVSFKDSYYDEYITVEDNKLKCRSGITKEKLTENEKFRIHTEVVPEEVTGLRVDDGSRTTTTLDLSWTNPKSIYTSLELYMKEGEDGVFNKLADLSTESSYQVTDLNPGTKYTFKLRVVYKDGDKDALSSPDSEEVSVKTRAGDKPATPTNIHMEEGGSGSFKLSWDRAENAEKYKVMRAPSMFGEYQEVTTVTDTVAEVTMDEQSDRYSNYYRIVAVNGDEESAESACTSLETEMFGRHTLIFAPTDKMEKINELLQEVFDAANDYDADAQFKGENWQVYFKKGDYTKTSCMYLGFYTSFNGLGKTPYDVKLNNIAIPAYLPGGALGAGENNATCNFWRSAENLSVIDTGAENGKAGYGVVNWREEHFNWAVAQAAPLRRVYSTRKVAYDWNNGWASGGYVADCFIDNADEVAAGTYGGQQFYTRNTKVTGGVFGTTLNNFFQGIEAANLLNDTTGDRMYADIGYTNWGKASDDGGQQVFTQIDYTAKISEKPFLYLDDNNEYQIFVPAVQENTKGISWGEGKDNNGMGKGTSLSLETFYIASPEDSAATINAQIDAGKNIYFTPGIYHAEIPIDVDRKGAILLGSGMTSIIPDNGEMAMKVADLDGIRIEGLIFDAGLSSKYLLQVGEKGKHTDHSSNPIILQDLFFRVGGTTDVLTKSDDALEINSDDVIGDHFWIWRADHGAGVEWYGNESKHGLIVNGDNVTCYALFNEHFQEYHTLWNGENGATYFYQNETCYDPISQEAWMSHGGTVNGYSSYKVNNDVDKHYAVGLGIYNVFIYTGPTYDSKEVSIQLDNAIEVPNKPGVTVENACIQTFANEDCALQKINHIVNGVGGSVSSGYVKNNPTIRGESWSRKFLLYYNNGKAKYGKETNGSAEQKGKFIGLVASGLDEAEDQDDRVVEREEAVQQPEAEKIYIDRIQKLYWENVNRKESDYKEGWTDFASALQGAKTQIDVGQKAATQKLSQDEVYTIQKQINIACTKLEAAVMRLKVKDGVQIQDPSGTPMPSKTPSGGGSSSGGGGGSIAPGNTPTPSHTPAPSNTPTPSNTPAASNTPAPSHTPTASNTPAPNNTPNPNDGNNIQKIPATKLTINTKKIYIVKGKSIQMKGVMEPFNTTDKITWSTSKKSVATVKNGKITAKKAGTAMITAKTTSGKKVVCSVYVVKKAKKSTSIKLNQKEVTLERGSRILLKPTLKPAKSTDIVKWKSSNKEVASVDAYGFVTGKKTGKATITATTSSGKKVKCIVTVGNEEKIDEMITYIYELIFSPKVQDFLEDLFKQKITS